ncbi:MAG: hypothetical protein Q8R44_07375 [Novosphingobium sp.]|nr:hypothetical protein [Novosphingobium sp.]
MTWMDPGRPTRAVNVSVSRRDVEAMCARRAVAISAIEELPDGGTHVVLVTLADADTFRQAFKDKLLGQNVRRTPFRSRASDWAN